MSTFLKGEMRGRRARLERTNDGWTFNETRRYVVISNDVRESPVAVVGTPGIPIPGLTITSSGAVCKSVDPEQDEKQPKVWRVNAEFSTEPINQKTDPSGTPDPNPTNWIPLYKGVIETYADVMYADRNGKRYVNSANDKFPEPLVKNSPIIVYEFTQYEPNSLTDRQIGDRNDSTNNAVFRSFDKWTLKLNIKGFERGYYFGYECVKIDYRVAYKQGVQDNAGEWTGWKDIPLDMGYSYFTSAKGSGGAKVTSQQLVALNQDGTKKADNADPEWIVFEGLKALNFSSFLRT